MRNDSKYPMNWGLPGGKIEPGESLLTAIDRECQEELGGMPQYLTLVPIEKFTSNDDGFCYNTFFCCVSQEFIPVLNSEHHGYAWIDINTWPKPMHPGLWNTVNFEAVRQKINIIQSQF